MDFDFAKVLLDICVFSFLDILIMILFNSKDYDFISLYFFARDFISLYYVIRLQDLKQLVSFLPTLETHLGNFAIYLTMTVGMINGVHISR